MTEPVYSVFWSEEDQQWVGSHGIRAHLAATPEEAIRGIIGRCEVAGEPDQRWRCSGEGHMRDVTVPEVVEAPVELHEAVVGLLDAVGSIRRRADDIQRAYSDLDARRLDVDDLGPVVAPADALAGAKVALAHLDDALLSVVDAVYDTMRHTARLKERND